MSLANISERYRVPAQEGRRITVNGRRAVIVGSDQAWLLVRFGDGTSAYAHPTWRVDYDPIGGDRPASPGNQTTSPG